MKNTGLDLQTSLNKFEYQWQKFIRNSWPINWEILGKKEIVTQSFLQAPYILKALLAVGLLGALISFSFLSFGLYEMSTVRVATSGGNFNEALFNTRVQKFNPALEMNEAEKKVSSLLYHPLYRVDFPNYLGERGKEVAITPVLLETAPEWEPDPTAPESKFYALKFKLKDNIKWSDGSAITNQDVFYTFQRIQENGGNSDFKGVFSNYSLEVVPESLTEFKIVPKDRGVGANPQLIYLANFSPISQKYYSDANGIGLSNDRLQSDLRSVKVGVTSGYFNIKDKIQDAETKKEIENPTWNAAVGYNKILLTANSQTNFDKIFLDKYVFEIYSQLQDAGGAGDNSLQRKSREGKVDLFTRFLNPSVEVDSSQIKEILNLEQSVQPTNTFLNLYLNMQSTANGLDGYFINQTLRKYVICQFIDYNFPENFLPTTDILKPENRLLPIQFEQDYKPDCANIEAELTGLTNTQGRNIYSIEKDEKTGIKRVKVFGTELGLNLLALNEFSEYSVLIQEIMKNAGLPVQTTYVNSGEIEQKIAEKNYHLSLLPVTLISRNLYPIYGLAGQNVSNITRNERANGREIEKQLIAYSESDSTNQEAKNSLVEFFKNEFVGVNLFRSKREFNYSKRVVNLSENMNKFIGFSHELYYSLPAWYIETKRKFKFS